MNGRVLLQTLEKSLLWQRLRQMSEEGAVVEATVEQVRPAGLIVRVTGSDVTGFVPGSHISSVHARAPLHVQI
jgi:ribosomal protein S1